MEHARRQRGRGRARCRCFIAWPAAASRRGAVAVSVSHNAKPCLWTPRPPARAAQVAENEERRLKARLIARAEVLRGRFDDAKLFPERLVALVPRGRNTGTLKKSSWAGVLNQIVTAIRAAVAALEAKLGAQSTKLEEKLGAQSTKHKEELEEKLDALDAKLDAALNAEGGAALQQATPSAGAGPARSRQTADPAAGGNALAALEAKVNSMAKNQAKIETNQAKIESKIDTQFKQLAKQLEAITAALASAERTTETRTTVRLGAAPAITDGEEKFGFDGFG